MCLRTGEVKPSGKATEVKCKLYFEVAAVNLSRYLTTQVTGCSF